MASMFCVHDRLHCDICEHHVNSFTIQGETVPKLGASSLVPKGRKDKDVRIINGEKHYFNWGAGKWFKGVKDTEAYAKKKDWNIGENVE